MSSEREAEIAKALRTALNALAQIKQRYDCDYIDAPGRGRGGTDRRARPARSSTP